MGHDDIDRFLDAVRLKNPGFTEFFSSLKHLLADLRRRIRVNDHSQLTFHDAVRLTNKPTDERLLKYHDAIENLCADWNRQPVAVPAVVHVVEPAIVGDHILGYQAEPHVQKHLAALQAMYEFAVLDAVTFNCKDDAALARLKAHDADPKRIETSKKCGALAAKHSYGPGDLKSIYPLAVSARAGICTTLAIAAAYVLTEGKHQDARIPRVEIISCSSIDGTHVFVIVARLGELLSPDTWGQDCRVVDIWNVGMGRTMHCMENPHTWAVGDWRLRGLKQHYDSIANPPVANVPHIRFDAVSLHDHRIQRDAEQAQRRQLEQQDEEKKEEESGQPGLGRTPCPYCQEPQHKCS